MKIIVLCSTNPNRCIPTMIYMFYKFFQAKKFFYNFRNPKKKKKKASVTLKALQFGDTPFSRAYRAMMMNFKTPLAMQKLSLPAYHLL